MTAAQSRNIGYVSPTSHVCSSLSMESARSRLASRSCRTRARAGRRVADRQTSLCQAPSGSSSPPCPLVPCGFRSNERRTHMAVLMTAHIPGATKEMIDGFATAARTDSDGKRLRRACERAGARRLACDRGVGLASGLRGVVRRLGQASICRRPMPSITVDELNEVVRA